MFVLFVSWLFGVGKVLSDNEKCYFLRIHRQGSSYPMAQDSHATDSVIGCSAGARMLIVPVGFPSRWISNAIYIGILQHKQLIVDG
jgi:hypothetical protein